LFAQVKVCTARSALSETCSADGQCVLDGWCHISMGICQAKQGLGGPCLMDTVLAGDVACQAPLKCMSNGKCLPIGTENEPCNTLDVESCEAGQYCSRVDLTCQPPAAPGEPCNPYSPVSCAGDLGCLCDDPACVIYGGDPEVSDTLHTCLPRRQEGDPCLHDYECETGSQCLGDPQPVCTAPPAECVP
jgi:hypothetical protein